MNVFGAIDNLAWIWSLERNLTRQNGDALIRTERVFIGKNSKVVTKSLTPEVKKIVSESKDWFEKIGDYRHGIAHQIPLYIPRVLSKNDAVDLEKISVSIDEAIVSKDSRRVSNLVQKKFSLGDFGPYMALGGSHDPILLHAQMICDYSTVVHLGEAIFREIDVI